MSFSSFPLYQWVQDYADLGWHRTGTSVDQATVGWLADLVSSLEGQVEYFGYGFPKYDARVEVEEFHLEALYYSFIGEKVLKSYAVEPLTFDEHHDAASLQRKIDGFATEAKAQGLDGLVLATGDDQSGLVAINQEPGEPGKLPIALVAGKDYQRLRSKRPAIRFEASINNAKSANLLARFGDASDQRSPIMITTPMSGWFTCAGERGTGLVIAVVIASFIAKSHPVVLLCPSGHELGYLGAERFVECFEGKLKAILHIGSCVAVRKSACSRMTARSNLQPAEHSAVAEQLSGCGIELKRPLDPLNRRDWFGEAECWASAGIPMVSVAGTSHDFHTIDDLPERATDKVVLEERAEMFLSIAKMLAN